MRNPALASSIDIPAGSIAAIRAFCCGLREIFAEMAFGSGAVGAVVVGVVVVGVVVVGVVVVGVVMLDVVVVGAPEMVALRPDFGLPGPFAISVFAGRVAFDEPVDFGVVAFVVVAFGAPPLLGAAFTFGAAFEPAFGICAPAFGPPLAPSAACGPNVPAVTTVMTNARAIG